MEQKPLLYRFIFFVIACTAALLYQFTSPYASLLSTVGMGLLKGIIVFALIMGLEGSIKKISLRSFNTFIAGLGLGAAGGFVICSSYENLFNLIGLHLDQNLHSLLKIFFYLSSMYIGVKTTHATVKNWGETIPFLAELRGTKAKTKPLLLDQSALYDTRLLDLARTKILDAKLILPSFVLNGIQSSIDSRDEETQEYAKKCLEQLRRLEMLDHLGLEVKTFQTDELDPLEVKLAKAAKSIEGYILSSEQTIVKVSEDMKQRLISIEDIAHAVKPSAQRGEVISIKIQRLGKEHAQGVGYLDDGTMVVVNGGGAFLQRTIKAHVLSQKYSSSGKIIFCNAITPDDIPVRSFATQDEGNKPSYLAQHGERENVLAGAAARLKRGF